MACSIEGGNADTSTAAKFCDVETLLDRLVALRLSNTKNEKQISEVIDALTRLQLQKRLIATEGGALRRLWRIWIDIWATGQSSITNLDSLILAECSNLMFAQNILYHVLSMADKYDNYKSKDTNTQTHVLPPATAHSSEDAVPHITAPTLAPDIKSIPLSARTLQGKVFTAWIRSGGDIDKIYDSRDLIQKLVDTTDALTRKVKAGMTDKFHQLAFLQLHLRKINESLATTWQQARLPLVAGAHRVLAFPVDKAFAFRSYHRVVCMVTAVLATDDASASSSSTSCASPPGGGCPAITPDSFELIPSYFGYACAVCAQKVPASELYYSETSKRSVHGPGGGGGGGGDAPVSCLEVALHADALAARVPGRPEDTQSGDAVADSAAAVAGSGDAVAGSGDAVAGSGDAVAEAAAAVAGSAAAVAGSGDAVAGSGDVVAGSAAAVAGSGDAVAGSGDAVAGSVAAVAGSAAVVDTAEKLGSSFAEEVFGPVPPPSDRGLPREVTFLVKTDDTLHNDAFVMDVMRDVMHILDREARGKWWMKPYQIVALSPTTGIMEALEGVQSVSRIKKEHFQRRKLTTMRGFFEAVFGPPPAGSMASPAKAKVVSTTAAVLATATATAAVAVASGGASIATATATAASAALAAVQAKRVIKKTIKGRAASGQSGQSGQNGQAFAMAQSNFIRSLATYSLFCYLLRIKDRNDGNIMIDRHGHLLHIDFGNFLGNPLPGGFEKAPFKLTEEYVEVMGGVASPGYVKFQSLLVEGLLVLCKHRNELLLRVEAAALHTNPSYLQGTGGLSAFRARLPEADAKKTLILKAMSQIDNAAGSHTTWMYDIFQRAYVGLG